MAGAVGQRLSASASALASASASWLQQIEPLMCRAASTWCWMRRNSVLFVGGDAALFPEERELGVALIDIGGGTTDIIIFHNGAVMHTAVLPVGGNHLTGDVAAGLRTPLTEAERLKINYGVATNQVVGPDELVQVPGVGGREPREIARRLGGRQDCLRTPACHGKFRRYMLTIDGDTRHRANQPLDRMSITAPVMWNSTPPRLPS